MTNHTFYWGWIIHNGTQVSFGSLCSKCLVIDPIYSGLCEYFIHYSIMNHCRSDAKGKYLLPIVLWESLSINQRFVSVFSTNGEADPTARECLLMSARHQRATVSDKLFCWVLKTVVYRTGEDKARPVRIVQPEVMFQFCKSEAWGSVFCVCKNDTINGSINFDCQDLGELFNESRNPRS